MKKLFAEFFGTFALVFAGTGAITDVALPSLLVSSCSSDSARRHGMAVAPLEVILTFILMLVILNQLRQGCRIREMTPAGVAGAED